MNVTYAGSTCRRHSDGFLLAALPWRASGEPATWSPHPEFSALPLITVPTTRRCNFAMCVIRPSALRPHRRACIVRHGHAKAVCGTRESRRSSTSRDLWFTAGRTVPDGNAGAVGFHDRAYYDAGGHDSSGLRTGWQWDLAGLRVGDRRRAAGGALHQPLCTLLVLAGLSVYVCFDDIAALDGGRRCLESTAGLPRYGSKCRRWFLSLCERIVGRCHEPYDFNRSPDGRRYRRVYVDCVPRCENFSAVDALDRSGIACCDPYCSVAGAGGPRFSSGQRAIAPSRHDGQRIAARPCACAFQFRRI